MQQCCALRTRTRPGADDASPHATPQTHAARPGVARPPSSVAWRRPTVRRLSWLTEVWERSEAVNVRLEVGEKAGMSGADDKI
jgi:hypothetical protein